MRAAPPERMRKRLSTETIRAARDFCERLVADFDSEGGHVVAGWSKSGCLLVAIRGPEARRLARLLERENIAIPDGDSHA